jgi:hypothetical protein
MPPREGIQEDFSESASASVSTAMHHMIDGLVDSEISDDPQPVLNLTPFSPEQSHPTLTSGSNHVSNGASRGQLHQQHSTLTAQDLVNQMLRSQNATKPLIAPNMEREETMRPLIPSLCETPFPPSLGGMDSPQTRATTAHKVQPDSLTPVPLSSGTVFQQDILRRQQLLQMQSTPTQPPVPPSSWSYQGSLVGNQLPPLLSSSSTADPSPYFYGEDIPRRAPWPACFGAIGQMPPSPKG